MPDQRMLEDERKHLLILRDPPRQRAAPDMPERRDHRLPGACPAAQPVDRHGARQVKRDAPDCQHGGGAQQPARQSDRVGWQQRDKAEQQQRDSADRLAGQADRDRDRGHRAETARLAGDCDRRQRRQRGPDAVLVAVLEERHRPMANIAIDAVEQVRMRSVERRIEPRSAPAFDHCRGQQRDPRPGKRTQRPPCRRRSAQVQPTDQPRPAPGGEQIRPLADRIGRAAGQRPRAQTSDRHIDQPRSPRDPSPRVGEQRSDADRQRHADRLRPGQVAR